MSLPLGCCLFFLIISLFYLNDSSLPLDERPKSLASHWMFFLKWLHLSYPTSPLKFYHPPYLTLCFQPYQMSPSSFKATGSEPVFPLALCFECPSSPSFPPILQQSGCGSPSQRLPPFLYCACFENSLLQL